MRYLTRKTDVLKTWADYLLREQGFAIVLLVVAIMITLVAYINPR